MNKHRAWLADMARKKANLNMELEASARAAEAKRTKFVAYTKSIREAVRQRQAETGQFTKLPFDKDEEAPAASASGEAKPQLENAILGGKAEVVKATKEKEKEQPAVKQQTAEKPKAVTKAEASKPRWALTEEKATAVEDEEADALVEFANNLDYDAYIDDLEVRQALTVIRERIDTEKAMAAAAEAAEAAELAVEEAGGDWRSAFLSTWNGNDDDAFERSSIRSSRRGGAEHATGETKSQPDWDSSTAAGDAKKSIISEGVHIACPPAHEMLSTLATSLLHLLPYL